MWYKLIKASNNDLYIVAFDGSHPVWKKLMFGYGYGTSKQALRCAVEMVEGSLYWDESYFDDNDLAEIPLYNDQEETDDALKVPSIDMVKNSPNQSERNGSITHIVLHNTDGGFSGSVSWLCNPAARASAHLVIGRDGQTAQLVPFEKKAWHAGNSRYNANSIGIEIEATNSQRGMTDEQQLKVFSWVKYLMRKYDIPVDNVIIHRWVRNTDCPGLVWPTDDEFKAWRDTYLV